MAMCPADGVLSQTRGRPCALFTLLLLRQLFPIKLPNSWSAHFKRSASCVTPVMQMYRSQANTDIVKMWSVTSPVERSAQLNTYDADIWFCEICSVEMSTTSAREKSLSIFRIRSGGFYQGVLEKGVRSERA